jgi:hypothetical protein
MKFLSVLLLACMLFLSFAGINKAVCKRAVKDNCHKKTACSDHKAKKQNDGCEKQGCTSLFACSNCGFLPVAALYIRPGFFHFLPKPVPLEIIGNLSGYQNPDWKPPKPC